MLILWRQGVAFMRPLRDWWTAPLRPKGEDHVGVNISFVCMCLVCMFLWVRVYMEYVCTGVCMHVGDRSQQWCPVQLPYLLSLDLSLSPELTNLANLASQLAPWIPCLCLLSAGIISMCHHAQHLCRCWRFELRPSSLSGKHFTNWAITLARSSYFKSFRKHLCSV